ncbi:MAG: ABC transporter ATP-binding protein [Clostridiales bacterium]|nr:ABC transporter ATP-binding protein [Clostridiales bacterium]
MERKRNRPAGRGGPHGGMGAGEKPKDFKGTFKKLTTLMSKYKWGLLLVVLLSMGSALFSIVGPKKMGEITTVIFNGLMSKLGGGTGVDFTKLAELLLWLLGLYAISSLLSLIQGMIMAQISQKVSYNLRKDLAAKVHRMPMSYFDRVTHGEVLSRVTNDVDTLGQSLNQSLTQIVSSATTLIGVLVMMLSISWQMTLVALCILPIGAILVSIIVKKSQKYFVGQQKYLGEVNGQVEEVFSGHVVVKAFNAQNEMTEEFDRTNNKLFNSAWKSQFLSGLMNPVMGLIGNLGYVASVVLGSAYAASGLITVGDIQSFIQYVRSFNQPIAQVAQIANVIQSTVAAGERVFEFLEEEEEVQKIENPVSIKDIKGEVSFDHVKFGYAPDHTIINDFSADAMPGQRIAIAGPTGAGKTTMVRLLMRFYDVTDGSIKVDGHDIRDFDRNELRLLFGMVLQDTWLFNGTIEENIRYGRLDATDEEVVKAARAAHAHHFIKTQPNGYQMELNEESSNISQGQKQLLTIARAILADPKIMILDEATSSVDTRTEALIQKGMNELMKGRTSFIIAHRLSTIRDADLILVMKDGDIVEQGKHEELLARGGFYKELYQAQFEKSA